MPNRVPSLFIMSRVVANDVASCGGGRVGLKSGRSSEVKVVMVGRLVVGE